MSSLKERATDFVTTLTNMVNRSREKRDQWLKMWQENKAELSQKEYWRGYYEGLYDAHAQATTCYKLDR